MTTNRRVFPSLMLALFTGLLLSGCSSPGTAAASNSSFDFGQVIVSQTSTRDVVTITNTGQQTATLSAALNGDASLKLRSDLSCGASLVSGGVCSMVVGFTPQTSGSVSGSLAVTLTSGTTPTTQTVQLAGTGVQLSGGESLVTQTANPLVALYSFQPEEQGTVHVEFGTDTTYGRSTASVATPANDGPVAILVAGMKQNTTYHMRAVVTETDGTVVDDQDHTFKTGSFPASMLPTLTATTSPGQTPQPGIELLDATAGSGNKQYLDAYAIDLQGNIIWGYNFPDGAGPNTIVQPIKLMPNGNFLVELSFASQFVLPNQGVTLTPADESVDLIREIDLAGDPVAQITMAQLNAKLAAAGYNMTLLDFHHDVAILPNGHIIAIANMIKPYTNLTGYSGTTNVLGDVLVDLDQNFNVSWVWSEFDHLDVNRHPIAFPDWTHTNAVVYSPDDGDLLVSMRHQSWIIKIDYENGTGSGDILWRLGNGGDFTLNGGTAPEDWFYGEHDPTFASAATSGQFSLAMMDNGYGRILADGSSCTGSGSACYTTAPIMAINEAAKTATITFRATVPAAKFSVWGGSGTQLANGDLEYDLCALSGGSEVDEVTTTSPSQPVWTLQETGENLYRAHRLPSLYPGVQW
ncbi:MAG: aryl-sulfate sulfotransferase [Acidobacteriaceae bacterium]